MPGAKVSRSWVSARHRARSGVPLYRALGYRVVRAIELECCGGLTVDSVEMAKELCDAPKPLKGPVAA